MSIESDGLAPSLQNMLVQVKNAKITALLRQGELTKPLNITNQSLNVNYLRKVGLSNHRGFNHIRPTLTTAEYSKLKKKLNHFIFEKPIKN